MSSENQRPVLQSAVNPVMGAAPVLIAMKKVTAKTAKDIAQYFDFQEEQCQSLLSEKQTPAEFLQALIDNGHYYDAVNFLAHAIPVRESVWWACVCVRYHIESSDVKCKLALKAAEAWVYDPSEQNRRVAEKHAEEGGYATAASWAAAAAFWSGGSIIAVGEPAVEPAPYLYAHAVAGAIVMAAGLGAPDEAEVVQRYQTYLQHGINIANGSNG